MQGYTLNYLAANTAELNTKLIDGAHITAAHCMPIPDPIPGSTTLWYTMAVDVPTRIDNATRHRIGAGIASVTTSRLRWQFGYINVSDPTVHRRDKLPGSKANYVFSIRVRHAS